ncbi:MAG: hypothetical protein KJZ91_04955, partial [Myxococcales bacterium]|nr:hypothetical protein [Myxococcales bacterium]
RPRDGDVTKPSTGVDQAHHRLLATPIVVDAPSSVGPAYSGASGRYGFGSIRLDDVSPPIDPVAALVLNDDAPGVGLVQFAVYNVTTEPVFLTVDFQRPTGLSYERDDIRDRWGETARSTVNLDCGRVVIDATTTEPNYSLPGCNDVRKAGVAGSGGVAGSASGSISAGSASFTVRVFEESGPAGELTPCLTCAVTSMPGAPPGYERVVVQLPARPAPNPVAQLPRKLWVHGAIRTVAVFRPQNEAPPFADIAFQDGTVVAGKVQATETGCTNYRAPLTFQGNWFCIRQSTQSRYRGLTRARLTASGQDLQLRVFTSLDGVSLPVDSMGGVAHPAYFSQFSRTWGQVIFSFGAQPVWNTTEVLPPIL